MISRDDTIEVVAEGTSRHSAFPMGSVNAIHELAAFLADVEELGCGNKGLFGQLAKVSSEYYGKTEGIDFSDEVSGDTTCAATVLSAEDGRMCINLNIRYAITQDSQLLTECLRRYGEERIFSCFHHLSWKME